MVIIGRAINGISINGNEYLLDEKNNVKRFESVQKAEEFLKDMGFTSQEIEECISIEEE
jgi:hypothetical protein